MEIADATTSVELDELANRVGDFPRKGPLIMFEEETTLLHDMAPHDRERWEEQRRQELTGLTPDEI